jgi:4-hydroxymandelate oxidase
MEIGSDGSGDLIAVDKLFEMAECQRLAEARMPDVVRINVQCAGAGHALRANVAAWGCWALLPKVLIGVTECDTSTTVLGQPVDIPVPIAPLTCSALCHTDDEVASARASASGGTIKTSSMAATRLPEDIGRQQAGFGCNSARRLIAA